jgi:uncharacterized membrane protein
VNRLRFTKPSIWRVLWSVVAVAVAGSVIVGFGLYIGAIAIHNDTEHTLTGDYIRLFIIDLTFWGPILLLTVWQVTVPVIAVLGVLVASVRKTSKPERGR